mgnify:CR=1 FL=1|jgi:hypothetical protein
MDIAVSVASIGLGIVIGMLLESHRDHSVVEHYRDTDQKFYERWCAYVELERRLAARAAAGATPAGSPPVTAPRGVSPVPRPD